MKRQISEAFALLKNPTTGFKRVQKAQFERVLNDYLKLLVMLGVVTAVVKLAFYLVRAVYLDLIRDVDIQYWRLANYATGEAVSSLMFIIFTGVFLLFILSFILSIFMRTKYVDILRLLFASVSPLLLFGWISPALVGLAVWSLILFGMGLFVFTTTKLKIRGTIKQRE